MGDLNFRIDQLTNEQVFEAISRNQCSLLLTYDQVKEIIISFSKLQSQISFESQLNIAQSDGKAFEGFTEAPITFPPTYKLKQIPPEMQRIGVERAYDPKRKPAYTDRILVHPSRFKPHVAFHLSFYNSLTRVMSSDHLPVRVVAHLTA